MKTRSSTIETPRSHFSALHRASHPRFVHGQPTGALRGRLIDRPGTADAEPRRRHPQRTGCRKAKGRARRPALRSRSGLRCRMLRLELASPSRRRTDNRRCRQRSQVQVGGAGRRASDAERRSRVTPTSTVHRVGVGGAVTLSASPVTRRSRSASLSVSSMACRSERAARRRRRSVPSLSVAIRLHRGLRPSVRRLGLGVTSLVPLVEERRNGDRGQESQNEHDDQELDQREAGLVLRHPLSELEEHLVPPLELFLSRQSPRPQAGPVSVTPAATRLTPFVVEPRGFAPPPRDGFAFMRQGTGLYVPLLGFW